MNAISVDESGNSGGDLCNLMQPVFALSAVIISEVDAESLLMRYYPREIRNHVEIKHTSILNSQARRRHCLEIHKEILSKHCAFSQAADKSYLAIERMCNGFFNRQESQDTDNKELLEHFWGYRYFKDEYFFDLVRSYNIAADNLRQIDNGQGEKVKDKERAYQIYLSKIPEAIRRFPRLSPVLGIAIEDPEYRRRVFDSNSKKSDPTTMRVLRLVVQMQKRVGDRFTVHIDQSPQYSGRLRTAIEILNRDFPHIECPCVRSNDYYAMQIADLIAGDIRCAAEYAYGYTIGREDKLIEEEHGRNVLELYRNHVYGGIEFIPTWKQIVRLRNMNEFYKSCM